MSSGSAKKTNDASDSKDLVVSKDDPRLSAPSKNESKLMSRFCVPEQDDPIILLNIGGTHMSTRRSTLMCIPDTVLALTCTDVWSEKVTHDSDGRLFFDLDPRIFQYLLNQLREWSPKRRVFELPENECDRQRFRLLCHQLNFDKDLTDGIYRQEKFNKLCGHVLLTDTSLVAVHATSYQYAECRGMNVYSSGINRIVFVLKYDAISKYNTFIGIIWSGSVMQERSFELPTAYGWAGDKQVYLKGVPATVDGYGGYDSDVCSHDTLELTLNCQLNLISLFNHRTKKNYHISVDINEGCPFPWQFHINLYAPGDRVKIINS